MLSEIFIKDGCASLLARKLSIENKGKVEICSLTYVEGEKDGRKLKNVVFSSFDGERRNTVYLSELSLCLKSEREYEIKDFNF